MKKGLLFAFALFLITGSALRAEGTVFPAKGIVLEFRPSYFYPVSSDFRDIFGDGNIDYQLTGTFPVYKGGSPWLEGLNVWSAVDYFSTTNSTTLGNAVSIWILPVTFGVKYFFPSVTSCVPVNFYVASGMKYFFVHTHNNSDYMRTVNKNGMGGVVEGGVTITAFKHLVFDLFAAYSFRSFGAPSSSSPSIETTGLNISGVNAGGGIGYKF